MGDCFVFLRFSMASLLSRRSNLVPNKMIGVLGLCFRTSGTHLTRTLSKDSGFTKEKQIMNTSLILKRNKSKFLLATSNGLMNIIECIPFDDMRGVLNYHNLLDQLNPIILDG